MAKWKHRASKTNKKENVKEVPERIIKPKHDILDRTIDIQEANKIKRSKKIKTIW